MGSCFLWFPASSFVKWVVGLITSGHFLAQTRSKDGVLQRLWGISGLILEERQPRQAPRVHQCLLRLTYLGRSSEVVVKRMCVCVSGERGHILKGSYRAREQCLTCGLVLVSLGGPPGGGVRGTRDEGRDEGQAVRGLWQLNLQGEGSFLECD